ncbi:MAG: hypothetical protein KDA90_06955 [Planctomycetaceae bacterium]|nr:hypothetical protein [Planctomycetaceae bacterium]
MLTWDEAITIGCKKYRELYPKGTIPPELEEQGGLGSNSEGSLVIVHVTYWFEGESEPFYLFRASVNRESGDVCVTNAEDWHVLEGRTFDNSQSL